MTQLETIRKRRGLSRLQLATRANVSDRQIQNFEDPDYAGAARVNTMKAIAEALGVRYTTLFDQFGRAKEAKS